MEIVTNVLTVVWALRWVIVAIAFALLGCWLAETIIENRKLRRRVARLEQSNRILLANQPGRRRRSSTPIIAGRVRQ